MNTEELINVLHDALDRVRFSIVDEKLCQEEMDDHLTDLGVEFEREYRLSTGIVDFFLPRSGLAIEVKAGKRWSKVEVYRQCERYCKDQSVRGILLVTGKAQGMPSDIEGKPVRVLHLGLAYL